MAVEILGNSALHTLCGKLSSADINFARLRRTGDEKKDKLSIPGIYAERQVLFVLDHALIDSEIGLRLDLVGKSHPIDAGYRFVQSATTGRGRWVKRRSGIEPDPLKRRPLYEYDVIGTAQGRPFFVEVKSGEASARSGNTTRPDEIKKKAEILTYFFGTNRIAVIFAAPAGVITPYRQEELRSSGALLAELPISRKDFKNRALATAYR